MGKNDIFIYFLDLNAIFFYKKMMLSLKIDFRYMLQIIKTKNTLFHKNIK